MKLITALYRTPNATPPPVELELTEQAALAKSIAMPGEQGSHAFSDNDQAALGSLVKIETPEFPHLGDAPTFTL